MPIDAPFDTLDLKEAKVAGEVGVNLRYGTHASFDVSGVLEPCFRLELGQKDQIRAAAPKSRTAEK